jgi:hypothetical protein
MANQDNASLDQNNKAANPKDNADPKSDASNSEPSNKNLDPQSELAVNALREEKRDAEADTQ